MAGTGNAPRLARPFVALFLAAMVAAALFVWEPWPITSFRLFSHLREEEQAGWVTSPSSTGSAFLHFSFQMREFEAASPERRDAFCQTWIEALGAKPDGRRRMRIYRVTRSLGRRIDGGERPAPPLKSLAYACTPTGARSAGRAG